MSQNEGRLRALMLSALDGDAAAETALLRALAGHFRAYFARQMGDGAADVEDLVQETLIAVHLKRHTYDRARPFSPWAYAVARYKLIDHFRRRGARREVPLEAAESLFEDADPVSRTARQEVTRLLDRLPARQRGLVEDVKLSGLSIEETSRKRGMSASAVKVSIHRSVKAMARSIGRGDG